MSQDSQPNAPQDNPYPDWTEKQLPPVKPPTTGLLMQLFFVPMIIVSIIVAVWLMFGWLAQSGRNPTQLADGLQQLNKGSWQDAHSLASLLQHPRQDELRHNRELAGKLVETLNGLLTEEKLINNPERHKLATYLCAALGRFEVDTGLTPLVQAVQYDDFEIRRAAIEGIINLAVNLEGSITDADPDLVSALEVPAMERPEVSSRDNDLAYGEIRCRSAYALGVIGGDEAHRLLRIMLGDPYPGARYNAATGLARAGDEAAIPQLVDMLQVENPDAVKYEAETGQGSLKTWKRNLIVVNGLHAMIKLYESKPGAKVDDRLIAAVEEIEAAGIFGKTDGSSLVLAKAQRFIEARK